MKRLLQNHPLRGSDSQEEACRKATGHVDIIFRVVQKLFEATFTPYLQLVLDSIWI